MARQRYGFDEGKIARFHKEGRGQGRGVDYKPWLTVRDVPSQGRSHRLRGMKTGRLHHLLSDIECRTFLLFDWADAVTDIREQFPLDRDATQRIAESIGVTHPGDVGTRTPLVMTSDLVIDMAHGGRATILARAIKPAEELGKPRVLEKLEIERRYWLEQEVDWGIITERDIPTTVANNIAWIHSYASLDELSQPYPGYFAEKAALLLREMLSCRKMNLEAFVAEMDLRLSMEKGSALLLVRHLLARKAIMCPMDAPIDDSVPLDRFVLAKPIAQRALG
ncbi:MAG: heteromeric transposase endonuclease subunit TnsA [Methylocystaceae bacterium]|nr:MAG: heteromeric transposase endonuclease subunit TnsA [Methylocystaceae bacterium]